MIKIRMGFWMPENDLSKEVRKKFKGLFSSF